MKKALITGSQGFIGSHLKDCLIKHGYEVFGFDHKSGDDTRDLESVRKALEGKDVVFNLAGLLGTQELIAITRAAVEVNILGTLNVLDAAKEFSVDVVEIGKPNVWLNTYSITKQAAEDFTLMYVQKYGLRAWVVKWFNVFGPRQHYGSPQKLAPTSIVRALKGEPIPVFGSGEQTTDHIYVVDAVEAAVAVYECEKALGVPVEVGSGEELTVNYFVDSVLRLTGSSSPIEYLPMRSGETENARIKADTKFLRETVGFHSKYPFYPALRDTVDYYREHIDEYGTNL